MSCWLRPYRIFPAECNAGTLHIVGHLEGAMSYQVSVTLQSAMQACGIFKNEPLLTISCLVVIRVDPQCSVVQLEKSTPDSLPELKGFGAKIFVTCSAIWSAHILQQTDWGCFSVNIFILQWYNIGNTVHNISHICYSCLTEMWDISIGIQN